LEQFGIDYVHKRNKIINRVSFKATKGAAKSMLNVDELTGDTSVSPGTPDCLLELGLHI
jgi:hypothetical protein